MHVKGNPVEYLERLLPRLAFISTPRIAHAVQTVMITLANRSYRWSDALNNILDTVLNILPLLPSIKELAFHSVHFSHSNLTLLQQISPSSIKLRFPTFDIEDKNPLPFRIRVKSLNCLDDLPLERIQTNSQFLSCFIQSSYLQTLIFGSTHAERLLTTLLTSEHPFSQLLELDMPVDVMTYQNAIPALFKCTKVESLRLRYSTQVPERYLKVIPPDILPNLSSFDGPHYYASLLAQDRRLHDVALRPFDNFSTTRDAKCILRTLQELGPDVETLDILAVTDISSFLPTLLTFKSLRKLSINSHPEFYAKCLSPCEITSKLSVTSLPPALEMLSIGVQMRNHKGRVARDTKDIVEKITASSPLLKELKLWYWTHPQPAWIVWNRSSEGVNDGVTLNKASLDCSLEKGS
ncbi:hypothetical protein BDQ12DRAFT_725497 [Crucibulum laeve]|uniref:F-box domain-containing protein n=1 Tax=Crucibulum laeve TaxID=68775 RepID=A0A5C3LT47_9AGAR|nr:hypothetical protein BDQ12DRAFT_725497 [Crucibulum laeve]